MITAKMKAIANKNVIDIYICFHTQLNTCHFKCRNKHSVGYKANHIKFPEFAHIKPTTSFYIFVYKIRNSSELIEVLVSLYLLFMKCSIQSTIKEYK